MVEDSGAELLPILKVDGIEYLVDVQHRELREFNDSANVINMHSKRGRKIVGEALGQQWHCFSLDKKMINDGNEMVKCDRRGNTAHT
ncbi:MAG: hypothetical protein ACYSYM_01660 [Planctomycetota bacterium]|jgi:hypothetical protein